MKRMLGTPLLGLMMLIFTAGSASAGGTHGDMKGMSMPTTPTPAPSKAPKGKADSKSLFVRVPTAEVCMVNNAHMGKAQIPVAVGGKTYYGCCDGCKKTLAEKPASRVAKDPLSGKEVDKALAFIGKNPVDSKIEYFESMENLRKYRP